MDDRNSLTDLVDALEESNKALLAAYDKATNPTLTQVWDHADAENTLYQRYKKNIALIIATKNKLNAISA